MTRLARRAPLPPLLLPALAALAAGGLQAASIAAPGSGRPLWWLQLLSLAALAGLLRRQQIAAAVHALITDLDRHGGLHRQARRVELRARRQTGNRRRGQPQTGQEFIDLRHIHHAAIAESPN